MNTDQHLSEDAATWIKSYQAQVVTTFTSRFGECGDRFAGWQHLIDRFSAAVETVLRQGRSEFHAVDEAHNELCIAHAILSNPTPRFDRVEYEPALRGIGSSIDFRATAEPDLTAFVDVKTIKPKPRDRWEQYQRAVHEGWLPKNVQVTLRNEWLGGELWHNMFAARSRMLEYAVELERKIAGAALVGDGTLFVLALCGEGFYWNQDELEDFVSFYRSGHHRADDPFSLVETKYIEHEGIALARTISQFAGLRRSQGDVDPKRLNWNVQPPSFSGFR
jgi:hypothetical protein